MNPDFDIQIAPLNGAQAGDPCRIRIAAGETVLTRLIREQGHVHDDAVLAAPEPLAFWLCDHWWRLRWEALTPGGLESPSWRLAHDMAAVGGGYSWPRLALWGDVDRVSLLSQADPAGVVGPVRYLTAAWCSIAATDFEQVIDGVLAQVADDQRGLAADGQALRALRDALNAERADPETARWRRLEARLGYNPDEAPDALMEQLNALADRYGLEAVEEALAATPREQAADALERGLALARHSGLVGQFSPVLSRMPPIPHRPNAPPWQAAEDAAQQVRAIAGLERGSLDHQALADLLGTATQRLAHQIAGGERLPYGIRLAEQGPSGEQQIALRAKWPRARRFELCRVLGDALWARDDVLGTLVDTHTARQQFQRAFAQSLLCPLSDLLALLNTDCPDDDDITAAAQHFDVGEGVVRTLLVNKGLIARTRLSDALAAGQSTATVGVDAHG